MAKKKKEDEQVTIEQSRKALGLPEEKPEPIKKTEAETAQAKGEAQDYIREREKLASKQGISSKEAGRQMVSGEQAKLNEQMKQQELLKQQQALQPQGEQLKQEMLRIKEEEKAGIAPSEQVGLKIAEEVKQAEAMGQPKALRSANIFLRSAGEGIKQGVSETLSVEGLTDASSIYKKILSFSDRKAMSTKNMEDTFNRASGQFKDDIENIKRGTKDPTEALANLRMMRQAVSKLEAKQKKIGDSDLSYWLADGKDIQEDIIFFNQVIEQAEIDMIAAATTPKVI
jgi:hypothetical protein